ncbi:carbonic anhydrase family protein [Actinoplanes sp. NPDC026623]|uniref:carbonic anhydrase family protein n=1 Tax=Actinoplanes sp. NPDC026623 TaxID=3155610 RepID=UPI0033CC5803
MAWTRRNVLTATGAAAAVIVLGPVREPVQAHPRAGAAAWNHDPASPIGPGRWDDLGYPVCGRARGQSPVDIRTGRVVARRGAPLQLRYETSEMLVANTGHAVSVSIPARVHDKLRIGDDVYELSEFHFHAPSEHTFDGRTADVEAHFVHTGAGGESAAVGVLYRRGHHPNPVLDQILRSASTTSGKVTDAGPANPADLLRHLRLGSYYAYTGSLTTPGCAGGLRWSVLADGGEVSPAAVARMHQLIARFPDYGGYPDNNRPVQPRNGRTITHILPEVPTT